MTSNTVAPSESINDKLWPPETRPVTEGDLSSEISAELRARMTHIHAWTADDLNIINKLRMPAIVKRRLLSEDFRLEFHARQLRKPRNCQGCRNAGGRSPPWGTEPQIIGEPLPEVARRICTCGLNSHMATALNQLFLLVTVAARTKPRTTRDNDQSRIHENMRRRLDAFQQASAADAVGQLGLALKMEGGVPVYHYCTNNDAASCLCICEMSDKEATEMLKFVMDSLADDREDQVEEVEQFGEQMKKDILSQLRRQERYDRLRAYEHCSACFSNGRLKMCACWAEKTYLDTFEAVG